MKQYILLTDYPPLKKDNKLIPVPGYSDPIPYALESDLTKPTIPNFWFLSFITSHPEIFGEVTENKKP